MINDKNTRQSFAVLDIEVLNDRDAYASYASLDPRAAVLRWPFRRVCSASVLTFSITEDGLFEFGHMDSYADADEKVVITKLFNRLRELPRYQVVTWSGLSHDLPILRMGAAVYEILLPQQLIHNARDRGRYQHLDLAVELKAHGMYTHLSEIAVRLSLPVKFGGSAGRVPILVEQKRWARLMEIAESDCICTAMVLCSHLRIHGALVSATAAHIMLLDGVGRLRRLAKYYDYLARVRARIARRAMADAEAFVATAAWLEGGAGIAGSANAAGLNGGKWPKPARPLSGHRWQSLPSIEGSSQCLLSTLNGLTLSSPTAEQFRTNVLRDCRGRNRGEAILRP